jgi:3-dehydroquinate dehydratase-2
MRVLVINGPNLNLLGVRRPEIYGTTTLPELEELCRAWGTAVGVEVETFQSNHEGAIIDRLHDALGRADGVVLNPGALTHYSYALHDAVEAISLPVVEVHLSDIARREGWRAHSVVSPACATTISGHGVEGYREALEWLAAGGPTPYPGDAV